LVPDIPYIYRNPTIPFGDIWIKTRKPSRSQHSASFAKFGLPATRGIWLCLISALRHLSLDTQHLGDYNQMSCCACRWCFVPKNLQLYTLGSLKVPKRTKTNGRKKTSPKKCDDFFWVDLNGWCSDSLPLRRLEKMLSKPGTVGQCECRLVFDGWTCHLVCFRTEKNTRGVLQEC